MTDKQKLKSLEQKMARLQKWYPDFDLKAASRHLSAIQKYFNLQQEHFLLKFDMEHCEKCGKKYKPD